jgi:hypothetical protein
MKEFVCPECDTSAFNWHITHVECQECGTYYRLEKRTRTVSDVQYNNADKTGWNWLYCEEQKEQEE